MDHIMENKDITDEDELHKKKGADHATIQTFNRQLILNYLRLYGPKSRAAISRGLGLSRATVSHFISQLEHDKLVYEGEKIGATSSSATSKGGKRATEVHFNINTGYIIGIDLGRSRLRIYLTNLKPEILAQSDYSFDIKIGWKESIPFIAQKVEALIAQNHLAWQKIRGIGLSIPGVPDQDSHTLISPPDLKNWMHVDIAMALRNALNQGPAFPIYLENDANMGALGESRYGAGRGVGNLIYIKLSTGIGAGLLLNGEIYRGKGAAGEFGHVLVANGGRFCTSCGKSGCLEATAGLQAIVKEARKHSLSQRVQSFKEAPITPERMVDVIIAAQEEGDSQSRNVLEHAGTSIGRAIGSCLINIYNPSLILLDGGSVRPSDKDGKPHINEILLDALQRSAKDSSMVVTWAGTQISCGTLKDDAVGYGTVATVIDNDKELNMPKSGIETLTAINEIQ